MKSQQRRRQACQKRIGLIGRPWCGDACCHGLPIRWTGETSSAPVMVLLVPNLYKLVTSSFEQPIHDGCSQPFA